MGFSSFTGFAHSANLAGLLKESSAGIEGLLGPSFLIFEFWQ